MILDVVFMFMSCIVYAFLLSIRETFTGVMVTVTKLGIALLNAWVLINM